MQDNSARSPKGPAYAEWIGATLLFLASYAVLAAVRRNYFNQDDNFSQFGPVILATVRSWFDRGIFPDWNPFQLMGAPVAETGSYALTYPFTYVSVWLATRVWNDPAAWVDVFFLLHALPGFLLTYRLLRKNLNVSEWIAMAASQATVFCGYNLVVGRSWYHVLPFILWTPLLLTTLVRFSEAGSFKWVLTAALAIGFGFHAGNVETWCYLIGFWLTGMGLLAFRQSPALRNTALKAVGLALMIGLGIAAPLLLVKLTFASDVPWTSLFTAGIGRYLPNVLLPYPVAAASFPEGWWADPRGPGKVGELFYAGTVFTICALAGTFYWLRDKQRTLSPSALCLVLGWMAFSLALAKLSFLPFLHLFWIVGGAVFLEERWANWPLAKKTPARFAVGLASILLVGYHLTQSTSARFVYGDVTYPPYPAPIMDLLQQNAGKGVKKYRVDSSTPHYDPYRGFLFALRHNFGTYYGITMLGGQDPVAASTPESRIFSLKLEKDQTTVTQKAGVITQMVYRDARLLMGKIDDPDPMVFALENRDIQFDYEANFTGLTVTNASAAASKKVLLNFLNRARFQAWVDDVVTTIETDEWGRMVIPTPTAWKQIRVRYVPAWGRALLVGLLLVVAGLFLTKKFRTS